MDFSFTKEQEDFRKEVRAFLEEELRKGTFKAHLNGWSEGYNPELSWKLGAKGWIGLTWPKEYGGQGRSYLDRLILTEELMRYGAPLCAHLTGDRQVGPALMAFGSEEQKRYFLPRIVKGEITFALGFSEPGAGSDLASLQTRVVKEGDQFVIHGQKVWNSDAHHADFIYLVARTDPQAPKHKGLSEFVVDLKLPGITIRPLIDMSGAHRFNEIFFDGVRIPPTSLIGVENRGWYQIVSQLDYERAGMERLMGNYPVYNAVFKYAKETGRGGRPLSRSPLVRHQLSELAVEFEVGRWMCYRVGWLLSKGALPNYETAMAKVYCTTFEQRLASVATQVLGLYGQLMPGSKGALFEGFVARGYVYCVAYTIEAGTSEILRNVIAMRGLGLPAR